MKGRVERLYKKKLKMGKKGREGGSKGRTGKRGNKRIRQRERPKKKPKRIAGGFKKNEGCRPGRYFQSGLRTG